ncbi:MAG: DUF1553 domain-containing protein [Candidatus Hydrogenedentes bacterium]|nr:DUF1553 domain-containing protein [Candidatus Hydrogenedentota bacterium]
MALSVSFCAFADAPDFATQVLPILEQNCFKCHGPEQQKSGLRLDSLAALFVKSAVVPGDPESSRMIQAIRHADADLKMPPDAKLPDDAIATLESWVAAGTPWPGTTVDAARTEARAQIAAEIDGNEKYWAFRPPAKPALPEVADARWSSNPIDTFVFRKLTDQGLTPSPAADRHTLIRRLYLDVLGLPPTPEEVDAFVANPDPGAYDALVDQVLASPHYGERWARHWLDVVRFAETYGFEMNQPRPNAWRYRDYVINAFNQDLPYTQFIREQLVGDALGADTATGFLVAGPKDMVTSPDIVLTKNQRDTELHDMVTTTAGAFLGLTAGCAKCHDHKFDPISQRDYYQMRAIFAGVKHGDREIRSPERDAQLAKAKVVSEQIAKLAGQLSAFTPMAVLDVTAIDDEGPLVPATGPARTTLWVRPMERGVLGKSETEPGESYALWTANTGQVLMSWHPATTGEQRIHLSWIVDKDRCTKVTYLLDADGNPATRDDQTPLATVDQTRAASQRETDTGENIWSGFFDAGIHTLTEQSAILLRADDNKGKVAADLVAMGATALAARPQLRPAVNYAKNEDRFAPIEAKALRFTVGKVNQHGACIDELEIYTSGDMPENIALAGAGAIPSASSEYGNELHTIAHLNDGKYGNSFSWIPKEGDTGWAQIDFPAPRVIDRVIWGRDREDKFKDRLATEYTIEVQTADGAWRTVANQRDRAPFGIKTPNVAQYATAGLDSAGRERLASLLASQKTLETEFKTLSDVPKIYGGVFTDPEPTHFLYRGDPMAEREAVNPGGLSHVGAPLQLTDATPEQERRKMLADWIASADNPLTARVMVNRIWQHHFGRGIVDTPSDFGAMGARPTNQELLDWLAATFIEEGWKPKALHRRILLSQTYRQSSAPRPDALAADAASVYLWRFPPRRLEAEPIRDAILATSGVLDLAMGGPGYNAFEPNDNYVRVYTPKKTFGPEEWRRMIYQYKPRVAQDETFGIFDCPDGGQHQPRRTTSTTPLQALNLLNSPFMNQQAELLARRLQSECTAPEDQAARAFRLAYSRDALEEEKAASAEFIKEHGLMLFCRALYNTNEFLYVN